MRPVSPSVSVIVPTLNEAENIEGIIGKILGGGASLDMEILVVDDGSRDETQAIVRRLSETRPVTLLAREKPKDGLAGAVLAGARAARAGVVLVIDADGSHPPEKIPELALPVIRGEKDMVIGSRYAPGGSTPGWSRKRRLMSRAASACAWPLTDVHDALSGFFAVRRELLSEIPSDAAGFKIALEILVRGGDSLRVGEAPIAFRDRELGQSKMGSGVILTYFRRLLALSGWRESQDSVGLAIAKTALVWVVDFALFAMAWRMGMGLGRANVLGFAGGAALNAWLKAAQLPREPNRIAPLLSRLVFVSLLAFFLRSGVLGTFARAFAWPWPAAIVPAIVTGWIVLFLGYALFIWPVREQYGRGVRWRVAAMGASAYLLALRLAYEYTLPVNQRTVDLELAARGIHGRNLTAGVEETGALRTLAVLDRITLELRHLGSRLPAPERAGFNLPALFCWILGAWAVFQGTQRIFDKTTAFRALLLFSVLPVFFWIGTSFGEETVLITVWAALLWLMTLTLQWEGRLVAAICVVAVSIFWWPGDWLWEGVVERAGGSMPAIVRIPLFVGWQAVLLTPGALIVLGKYYARWKGEERRKTAGMAGFCAVIAALGTFNGWMSKKMGIPASGAIWLPLLPFIAAEMQRPGCKQGRSWGPVIYGCILCYGLYFFWLAFPG